MLRIGEDAVSALLKDGRIPGPIDLAGRWRWRVREIRDWVAAGCPVAIEWRWEPSVPVRLDQWIRQLQTQIAEEQAKLQDLHRKQANGETFSSVRRVD